MATGLLFQAAWMRNDTKLRADAVSFWRKQKLLPTRVVPEIRANELCGLLYRNDEVVAVSTATIQQLPRFRCKMAVYRCSAAPSFRRDPLSPRVTADSRDVLEKWSREHPEEGVMAMAAIVESPLLIRHFPSVFWPASLIFMGYMRNGQPLFVSWFKHATINPNARVRRHGIGQVPQP